MKDPRRLAEKLLDALVNGGPGLKTSERTLLLDQATTALPEALLDTWTTDKPPSGLTQVLTTRLKNLLEMHRMTPHEYALLREKLLHRAYAIERDTERAEDMVQETFLVMIGGRDDFRGDSSYATWVHCILFRRIHSGSKQRMVSLDEPLASGKGSGEARTLAELLKDEDSTLVLSEDSQTIRQQLEGILRLMPTLLSERLELQALNLVAIQGCSTEEASKVLGITKNYLYRLVYTGRKKLLADPTVRALLEVEDGHASTHRSPGVSYL